MKDSKRDFIRMQTVVVMKFSHCKHIAIALTVQSVDITGFCCLRMKLLSYFISCSRKAGRDGLCLEIYFQLITT